MEDSSVTNVAGSDKQGESMSNQLVENIDDDISEAGGMDDERNGEDEAINSTTLCDMRDVDVVESGTEEGSSIANAIGTDEQEASMSHQLVDNVDNNDSDIITAKNVDDGKHKEDKAINSTTIGNMTDVDIVESEMKEADEDDGIENKTGNLDNINNKNAGGWLRDAISQVLDDSFSYGGMGDRDDDYKERTVDVDSKGEKVKGSQVISDSY